MPYESARQRAYMHIHHPKIAARWDRKYGGGLDSLTRSGRKKKRRRRAR